MSLCTDEELAIQKYIDTRQEFLEELQQALAKVSTEENDLSDSLSEVRFYLFITLANMFSL